MKNTLKKKAAGAGSEDTPESPADVLGAVTDGSVVFAAEPDAPPPDIIVEN